MRSSSRSQILFLRLRLLIFCVFLSFIPGVLSSRAITLGSIEIFDTHEWLASSPTIYFYCKGENKTILPDVTEKHLFYTFKGEESWQPLTELPDEKCKRCGLYEMDTIKSDDIFDEWELCPDDFIKGEYKHRKQKEFEATFTCTECASIGSAQTDSNDKQKAKKTNVILIIIIVALVCIMMAAIGVAMFKYWQKRKREKDQARFLKLFEEGDEIEDELYL